MNADNLGTAREVPAGRLANFEDGDTDQPLSLPTRTRRARTTSRTTSTPEPTNAGPKPVPPASGGSSDRRPSVKGPKDRVRPSNVHIPVRLLEPLAQLCHRRGLSHGEAIIVALEATHPRLGELIRPAPTTGGSLFDSRRSRTARTVDGPLTPLNYRLREADFEVLDTLVEQTGASSRGHLITAALTAYLDETD